MNPSYLKRNDGNNERVCRRPYPRNLDAIIANNVVLPTIFHTLSRLKRDLLSNHHNIVEIATFVDIAIQGNGAV